MVVLGLCTLAAITTGNLLLYLQHEAGETPWSLRSFLSWVDTVGMKVVDHDVSPPDHHYRGAEALLTSILTDWGIAVTAAVLTWEYRIHDDVVGGESVERSSELDDAHEAEVSQGEQPEDIQCPQCAATIPAPDAVCPRCRWTYATAQESGSAASVEEPDNERP
jgi:hypothetical protein